MPSAGQSSVAAGVPVTGSVATAADVVAAAILGSAWATAYFSVNGVAGTATVTAEYSNDNGQNWSAAPYAKQVGATSANPTVKAIATVALATGDIWEIPLPANCTHFRLRCIGGGTATNITISGGQPFVSGVPVVAVLYDTTSGSNAALDTGTLDVSGWSAAYHAFSMSGGTPAFSMQEVDDAGTSLANVVTGAAAFSGGVGQGAVVGGTAGLVAATAQLPLPRRMRYQSAAIVAQTSRIRLEARR